MSNQIQMNIEKFVADLSDARDQAIEACKDMDTFGTCNFDQVRLPVGKHYLLKRRSSKLEAALKTAGFRFVYDNSRFKYYTITFNQDSDGNRRTKQMQMIRNTMNGLGWADVGMFYMVD